MGYAAGLAAAASLLWACLSGRLADPVSVAFGVFAVIAVVLVAWRIEALDAEGAPYLRVLGLFTYSLWLLTQIALANIAVARKALSPRGAIAPTLVRYRTQSGLDLSRVIFANSVTLTPGTVTVEIEDDAILVHALDERAVSAEEFAVMERRVMRATGQLKGR
ncbi:MAG: Na+/H+ antiporter subunit E [Caulobacterales bacterium]